MKARATLILITLFCAMMASMQSARAATITVTNTNDSGAGSLRQALASGSLTCTLPPATIAVTRTAGGTTGTINESVYSMSADTGSNFRIDGCQYIYNLKSSALGVGTYRVDILINSLVVGSAAFQLKWPSLVSICNVYLPGKRSACPTIVNSFAANCRAGAPPAPFSHRVNRDQGSRRKSEVLTMKTKSKTSGYILRSSAAALLFSCAIVALCSAINLPNNQPNSSASQDNAAFSSTTTHHSRSLSFAERVAYQTVIEDVYWRHRIWPDSNPGPKPPLDKVISQADIEKKVAEYLRNSQALEDYWQRPLTGYQLQAEMERMTSNTKQPEVLQELFEALGNDPFVIAECLARPTLTTRLTADVLAQDKTGRFESLRTYELQIAREVAAIDSTPNVFGVQVLQRMRSNGQTFHRPYHLPVIASPSGGCTDDTWTSTTLTNAPPGRYLAASVWTGAEMIVWGGETGPGTFFNSGGRYDPSTDSWVPTSIINAPDGRRRPSAVWTGSEMIVWGGFGDCSADGFCNTGGRYNPTADSWTATKITHAPSARSRHAAVWTGSEMIVWGGDDGVNFNTGGHYHPVTDTWTLTNPINAPSARTEHRAVWTGTEMIVWGGHDATSWFNTGGRYDPGTDSWTPTDPTNAPAGRSEYTAVWTGSEMIVWGGWNGTEPLDTGGRYNPSTDSWTATSTINAPEARYEHTAVWAGSEIEMIVWGGREVSFAGLNTGGRYCAQSGPPTIILSANGRKVSGINTVRLTWDGATSTDIDVYRDGTLIITTPNDGSYTDSTGDTGRARYTYEVCEAGTSTCSNNAKVTFRQ